MPGTFLRFEPRLPTALELQKTLLLFNIADI